MITFILRLSGDKDIVYFCNATVEEVIDAYKTSCNQFNFQFHEKIAGDPQQRSVIVSVDNKLQEDVYYRLLEAGCPFSELGINKGEFKENNIGSLFCWFLTQGFKKPVEITVANEYSMFFNYFSLYENFTPLTIGNGFNKATVTPTTDRARGIADLRHPWEDIRIRI